jgi:hypothetical protein
MDMGTTIITMGPPYVPNKYASGSNSNELENTIRSFIATQKELHKKFIAKFESKML